MQDKSISPARQSGPAGDKQRTGDVMVPLFRSRPSDQQRTERERRDRYGRFGGR